MNLSLYIAKRYLVSKKSHNIINIISIISVVGVTVGTMALIIVLSVFNGFETLVKSLFNTFDPDLKITLVEGKTFQPNMLAEDDIKNIPGVVRYTEVLEETALLKYQNRQALVTVKGVGEDFETLSGLDSMIVHGEMLLQSGNLNYMILGYGVAYTLGANLNDYMNPIMVYAPRRSGYIGTLPEQAFTNRTIFPSGIFSIQQDFDTRYTIVPVRFARTLFGYENEVTAIEVGLQKGAKTDRIKEEIRKIAGENFQVKDRYEQQELLYKIMKSEKLAIFLILGFILFIATFNIIGTLTMLILDKRKDIAVLHSMGANETLIKRIFFAEGMLISFSGAIFGMLLGALICWIQIQFGIVPLHAGGGSFVIDAYPVELQFVDFLYVFLLVLGIGLPAVWYPVRQIKKKYFEQKLG
jgi:lipoprotein-releasing system permease protein